MNFKLNKHSYNLLETTNCDKLLKSVECIMIQMYETIFILTGYAIIDSKFRILKYSFYVYISCYNLTMVMLCGYYSFVMLINDYDVRDGIKIVFTSIKFMAKFSSTTFIPIFFWKNREKYIMLENSVETLSKHLGIHSKNAVALKYLFFCQLTTVYWLIDSVYIVYSSGSVSSFVHNYPDFVCHVVITKSVLTLSRIAKNFGCVNELFQSIENQNVFYEEFKHVSMVFQFRRRHNAEMMDTFRSENLRNSVRLFSSKINRQNVRIAVGGSFDVNLSLLIKILGCAATNVTLIMQIPFPPSF
ncbi:uncharacterized protein LOC125490347 [Plutella xylostella]|uniref:uncharacterized protein LOC125490347 n=1 Tax=Plutella xylostella TaxID=51655 RepID=UPI0020325467|nr:uncharacterized protein LOC125490347 [Plutella xylostella]